MIIDFIIEDLMLNSYLQKNFHTLTEICPALWGRVFLHQKRNGRVLIPTVPDMCDHILYVTVQYVADGIQRVHAHALVIPQTVEQ